MARRKKKVTTDDSIYTGVKNLENIRLENNKRIFFVLTNGVLNSLVMLGTVCSFLTSFEINCNLFFIILSIILSGMVTAFIYYNFATRIIGYLVAVFAFFSVILNYGILIRSGFSFIWNDVMEFLELYLDLEIERSYETYGYSENTAVTLSVIFIVFSTMLMVNMAISESKNFVLIFICTFPVVQLSLYFDRDVNMIWFVVYTAAILLLFFMRSSGHGKMEYKKRKGYNKRIKKKKKEQEEEYDYINDGRFSLSFVWVFALMFMVVSIVLSVILPKGRFNPEGLATAYKENTMDFTKRFVLVGFWGMFRDGSDAGGVGRDRMGQIDRVTLDYETDLELIMLPQEGQYSTYIKDFNGTYYEDGYWSTISEEKDSGEYFENEVDGKLGDEEAETVSENILYHIDDAVSVIKNNYGVEVDTSVKDSTFGKSSWMYINNVAMPKRIYYRPSLGETVFEELFQDGGAEDFDSYSAYKSIFINDDEADDSMKLNQLSLHEYYPLINYTTVDDLREKATDVKTSILEVTANYSGEESVKNLKETYEKEETYRDYVYDTYLDVPEENIDTIEDFCEKYELTKDTPYVEEKLEEVFATDYEYSLMPGVTPDDEEFVNYFLTEQKKGYCVYFATSSVLILRYLGIPARYTTGYVFWNSDYGSGTRDNYINVEWNYVESGQLFETTPYTYDVNDSYAHAWVEIYIDNLGWVPVEFTPASSRGDLTEETEGNGGIGEFLTNNVFTAENIARTRKTMRNMGMAILEIIFVLIIINLIVGYFVRRKYKKSRDIEKLYNRTCRLGGIAGLERSVKEAYRDYGNKLVENGYAGQDDMYLVSKIIEKNKFSGSAVTEEEKDSVKDILEKLNDSFYEKAGVFKKILYKYFKWL